MRNSEFKAWFIGYAENIYGEPNKKQWKRIKARIKEIDGVETTPMIAREYWRHYYKWPEYGNNLPVPILCGSSGTQMSGDHTMVFNSTDAMRDLGAADAVNDGTTVIEGHGG